ncbi:MAG: tetratricopeptide repeat protein [Planctomycetes bacterium]|nr:tetratricopeptide repeat protein [Planctomycetota bacterium]
MTIVISLVAGLVIVARNNSILKDRGDELERANSELSVRIENERRARLEADGVASTIETVLLSITSFGGTAASNVTVRRLLDEIGRRLESDASIDDIVRARIHYTLGSTYRGLELTGESEKHWLLALEACRRAYPEGNETTARLLHHLADLRTRRGYAGAVTTPKALEYLTEARALYVRLNGESSAEVSTVTGTAAAIELAGTEGLVTEPPARFVQLLAAFHPDLSKDQVRDGLSKELDEVGRLWATGDRDGAAKRVRFWTDPTLKGHPFIVSQAFVGIARVADWAIKNGRSDFGAGVLYERMLAAERVHGAGWPFVGQCIGDFARYLERRGEFREAFDWHTEATDRLSKICKPSSIILLDAKDYRARAAVRAGHHEVARQVVADRMEVTLEEVKPTDPIFADAFLMKSIVEEAIVGPEARLEVFNGALVVLRERNAEQNQALVLAWKAQALSEAGNTAEARRVLEEARQVGSRSQAMRKDVQEAIQDAGEGLSRHPARE